MQELSSRLLIDFMHQAADLSGAAILPFFRSPLVVENKSATDFDPVTAADQAGEKVIREAIALRFPGHGITGEEFEDTSSRSGHTWLIDPIDGTRAFMMGLPTWGTLIGITHEGKPVAGLMDQPFTGERFWGDGREAHFRTPRATGLLRTRPCSALDSVILAATAPDMFDAGERVCFDRLASRVRMRRFGGDCYAYCLLAMGFVDAVVEASLKPFDIVPLIPIIEGAGGVVTAWDGGPAATSSRVAASGDPSLHGRILEALNA